VEETCPLSFPVPIMALQLDFSFPNHNPYQQNHMLKPSSLKTFNISTLSSPSTSFSTPKHYNPQSTSHPLQEAFRSSSRRDLNLSVLALLITGSLQNLSNNITLAQELELERYTDSKEGFTLRRPSSYVQVLRTSVWTHTHTSFEYRVCECCIKVAVLKEFG
jgi:hypothetical protein